jgi:predicted site-specific integrase-resolvase
MTVPHVQKREKELPPSELILISEVVAARLCSVSLPTFRKWVRAGLIQRVELPGGLRRNLYRRADIEAFAADVTGA